MGILYLVATPIGNLEDITLRAIRILKEATLIAAEDTRTARHLLTHLGISKPITSYYEHNKLAKLQAILAALEQGDVALISEAGTPGLSDPGFELVCAALARQIQVVPIPGPSALVTALVASGLATDQFIFVGFLPRQSGARRRLLDSVAREPRTLVAYEAPHRVRDSLEDISIAMGNRPICVARELTKKFEEFFRGTVNEAREYWAGHEPRGEFTLVIGGSNVENVRESENAPPAWDDARVLTTVRDLIITGMTRTEAVKQVAQASGRDRREVYRLALGS